MNGKSREIYDKKIVDLLKQNFRGLDPWIPARPPLESVVRRYSVEAEVEPPSRVSYGWRRGTVPNVRSPHTTLALLAAAVVVAVGVASAPFFLRGVAPAMSGSPSVPIATPSGSPAPSDSPSSTSRWAGATAEVILPNLHIVRGWSPTGAYLAADGFKGTEYWGVILDRDGRQVERLAGSDGFEYFSFVGWLDGTTYVFQEFKWASTSGTDKPRVDAVRYVWGHAGMQDGRVVGGISQPCDGPFAIAKEGGLYIPIGTACNKYVRWTPDAGASEPREGQLAGVSLDGKLVSVMIGPDCSDTSATHTLVLENSATGAEVYRGPAAWPCMSGYGEFSPDSRHYVYVQSVDGSTSRPAIVDIASGAVHDIAMDPVGRDVAHWRMAWTGDDKLLALAWRFDDADPLSPFGPPYVFSLEGQRLPDEEADWSIAVAPDGTVARWKSGLTVGTAGGRTAFDFQVTYAVWSPDSQILTIVDEIVPGGDGRVIFIRPQAANSAPIAGVWGTPGR